MSDIEAVAVKLRARLGSASAAALPDAKRPGRGSLVTVIAILPKPAEQWVHRLAYAIDEWGQFMEVDLVNLIFEVPA